VNAVLLSTYDLGRQPFGLASPAAWLRRAGHDVHAIDLARDQLSPDAIRAADLVAIYLPMHTATRLALPLIDRVRAINPAATLCAYGLYAPLNEALLRQRGVTIVLGPEAEEDLVAIAGRSSAVAPGATAGSRVPPLRTIPRLQFIQPDRAGLPALDRYASLQMPDGTRRIAGATDATRGCKHRCLHCPIVPVYDGQFRVVPVEVVLADVRAQVEQGAQHITFGDPDFFNGPTHAKKIVEALHGEFPSLTYDAIIKVEHLLTHRHLLPVLAETGCLFVTSAVESVDDEVLAKLEKRHTRADFVLAAAVCRDAGLTLSPTFVAFTPWTTVDSYVDMLRVVSELDLVANVAPIQWGIRLLVTWQSRLLELPDIQSVVGPFDAATLTFPWAHPDPRVDALQQQVMGLAGVRASRSREEIFSLVCDLAHVNLILPSRAAIPYLNEPWYC
jgi:radical SAM superfamily enzyme YgiQ (UPF0313 family)